MRLCLTRRCSLRCPPRIRTRAEVAATGVVAVLVAVVVEVVEVAVAVVAAVLMVTTAVVAAAVAVVAVLVVAAAAAVMMMAVVTVEAVEEVVVAAGAVEVEVVAAVAGVVVEAVAVGGELLPRWPSSKPPCSTSAICKAPMHGALGVPLSTPWEPSHAARRGRHQHRPTAPHFSLRSGSGRVSQSPPVSRQARSRFPDPE